MKKNRYYINCLIIVSYFITQFLSYSQIDGPPWYDGRQYMLPYINPIDGTTIGRKGNGIPEDRLKYFVHRNLPLNITVCFAADEISKSINDNSCNVLSTDCDKIDDNKLKSILENVANTWKNACTDGEIKSIYK